MIGKRGTCLIAAALLLGAAVPGASRTGSAPKILGALVPAWLAGFARAEPVTTIVVPPPYGPPQGKLDPALQAFLDGRRDMAFLTRDMAEADRSAFRHAHHGEPVVLAVAGGAWHRFGYVDPVVVIVNVANPVRALSFRQLDALLSETRWRGGAAPADWGELGVPGWRGKAIHVVGGDGWSGEESARELTIRRRVLSVGGQVGRWRMVPGSGGEDEVVARVGSDPQAIGFTGFGHLSTGVRTVAIGTDARRPERPTRAAIASGAYPLARSVDLVMARDAQGCLDPVVARFASWLVGPEGQAIVRHQGVFLPLNLRQRNEARRILRAPCRL
ncbi:substrate-binding domain-containing protein [Sphingomonas sp. AR_OL41]|uniref:PstS family phosphate ABC transporter substrate-binding protein n=1 Tax=Sphingomonas sp. AR_OL41 TaxID=3042729 RepID=UPI00247FFDAE|nr:substrate-binding domain-containing protein [Sphingomonas sp. AR_OL41]MDH7974472.1 substrate-binding domain-containing protein [Sphingomonas sp. AR_OL41]